MNGKITGIDAYICIAALARLSGISENTALSYCKESFEMFCKSKGINKDDIIQAAANDMIMTAFSKGPFGRPS